ncbi:MAG: crtL [Ilumatobacteraceae bacterium]|nr:crtL [Ilumatobacteraceae bacterium]
MTHDVVIVGDGPAGRALGAACVAVGLDALVVGSAAPWTATYGAWADDVAAHLDCAAAVMDIDVIGTPPRRRLDRQYVVFDNDRLAARLDVALRTTAHVAGVHHHAVAATDGAWATVLTDDGQPVTARMVVDATGPASDLLARRASTPGPAYQSAYGLVIHGRPDVGGDAAILMDWRPPSRDSSGEPTFLYLVELGDGRWLMEETSLARRVPMPAEQLRRRLSARVGRDLTDSAERVEHVVIPMWPGVPSRHQPTVGFGAAAGYVHPATGYSVAASLAAAPRVALAIAGVIDDGDPAARTLAVWNAVWPAEARRARALHDYGSEALLRLPADAMQNFFDSFFDLPTKLWSSYLRVDTTATDVAKVMTKVFTAVPWSVRRRLAAGNPAAFVRLLR